MEGKELLRKKKEEIEEAEQAKRSKVVVTFDLVGRKMKFQKDFNSLLLRPADEREAHRIKPNPRLRIQLVFVDPGPSKKPAKGKSINNGLSNGLCLEISGRVQHDTNELKHLMIEDQVEVA